MISDDELKLMIHEYTIGTYSSSDEGDILSALVELEHYRRTFAKIEGVLRNNYDMTFIALEIVNQQFEAVLYQLDDDRAGEAHADTPFAALSALADSIIREELERKEPPHHDA